MKKLLTGTFIALLGSLLIALAGCPSDDDDSAGDDDTTEVPDDDTGDDDTTGDDDSASGDDDDTADDDSAGDDDTGDDDTGPVDADGDGFDSDADCDDSNAAIYPGAPEDVTNGVDDDCDAAVDEVQVIYIANTMAPNPDELPAGLATAAGCLALGTTIEVTDATTLAAIDPSLFHVVLVDTWTAGGAGTWMGDAATVGSWGLPILGFGNGGAALLYDLGAGLSFGDVNMGVTDTLIASDASHDFFNSPFMVLTGMGSIVVTNATVMAYALNISLGEAIAVHPDAADYGVLIHDTANPDWWLLGYSADGTQLTTEGFQLTANILVNLAGRTGC